MTVKRNVNVAQEIQIHQTQFAKEEYHRLSDKYIIGIPTEQKNRVIIYEEKEGVYYYIGDIFLKSFSNYYGTSFPEAQRTLIQVVSVAPEDETLRGAFLSNVNPEEIDVPAVKTPVIGNALILAEINK